MACGLTAKWGIYMNKKKIAACVLCTAIVFAGCGNVTEDSSTAAAPSTTTTAATTTAAAAPTPDESAAEDNGIDEAYTSAYYVNNADFMPLEYFDYSQLVTKSPDFTENPRRLEDMVAGDIIDITQDKGKTLEFVDLLKSCGAKLPDFENGLGDIKDWKSGTVTADYDPFRENDFSGEMSVCANIPGYEGLVIEIGKEYRPIGTQYVLDTVNKGQLDVSDKYSNFGGTVYERYKLELYNNKNNLRFITSEVALRNMSAASDSPRDLKKAGYFACIFTDDGCLTVKIYNEDLLKETELPTQCAMMTKSEFTGLLDEIDKEFIS